MVCFHAVVHDINITFGDEDGAHGASRRIYRRKRTYCQLYRTSGLYFTANYVEADYEVATFLALIGADAYGDKSFDELRGFGFTFRPRNVLNFIVGTNMRVKRSHSL